MALRGVVEDLDHRHVRWCIQDTVEIAEAEDVGDADDEQHHRIGPDSGQYDLRYSP